MAQAISNTLGTGLLAVPNKANTPINFGAYSSAPTAASSAINYNLPKPKMVTGLITPPMNNPSQTQGFVPSQTKSTQTIGGAASAIPTTSPVPPAGTANGYVAPDTQTTTRGLFPDVTSSLAYTAPTQDAALGTNASKITDKYTGLISSILKGTIGQEIGDRTSGAVTQVGEGNAQAAAAAGGSLIQGLTSQEQQELAGNSQAITAQNQSQSALSSAGNLAQPSGTFPFVFNPVTGQFTTSGGDLHSSITGGVQQAISNPTLYSALNSAIASTYGAAAAGMFQQAYIAAGGNPAVAAGQATGAQAVAAASGQTQASNIQTAGTAGIQAASTAYQAAVQGVSAATKSYSSLTGVSAQLNDTMANWGNKGQLTNYNQALNTIAGLTSDPSYQQFVTALANTQAAYSSVLGSSGVIPTQATKDALGVLNPNSSANAINAALNQLSKDAHALLIVPAYQQQSTYASQLGIK